MNGYIVEPAVGINGHFEDIPPNVIRIPQCIRDVSHALEHAKDDEEYTKWVDLYRAHADDLREVIAHGHPELRVLATETLRSLSLQQTLPFNELESDPDIDSYTGEPLPEVGSDEWLEDMWSVRKTGVVGIEFGFDPFVRSNELANAPYDDEEMNKQFLEANRQWPGLPEEDIRMDDRGYMPPGFEPTIDRSDPEYQDLAEAFEPLADALSTRIDHAILTNTNGEGRLNVPKARTHVRMSEESKQALRWLQEQLDEGASPAFIALLWLRFQHGLCWNWQEDDETGEVEQTDAANLIIPGSGQSLEDFIIDFEDELIVDTDPMPVVYELSEAQIERKANALMEEYYNTLPAMHWDATQTKSWVKGYIQAIESGAPISRQTANGEKIAYDYAWDAWRRSTCPAAAKAYQQAISAGASPSEANKAFYNEARRQGVAIPKPPKKVEAISGRGLRLSSGRMVNWRTAAKIASEEGYFESERLKSKLTDLGIGNAVVRALSA